MAVPAVLAALLVAACGGAGRPGGPLSTHAGTATVRLDWRGDHRVYLLHRPPAAHPGAPLVIVLHGASLTAEQTERYYHWDDLADADGFDVAYPQGVDKAWNAGSCCGTGPGRHTDDVGFVGAVVADATRATGSDPARVYLTGVSNGAMLALRFACERPTALAAVGSVAGTFTAPCDRPPALPLIEIHGLHDRAVPYLAGPGTVESGPGMRLPARETIDRWRAANGCAPPTVTTTGPVHVETSPCASGIGVPRVDVKVITIDGAGHQWPGATLDAARAAYDGPQDQPDTHVDATRELWTFFATSRRG
jgi:polyhydroxybutyrate depolymerase